MSAFVVFGRTFKFLWEDLLLLALMNMLATVFIVLIFPGPATLCALHHVCHRVVHGYAISWDEFWNPFRAHWRDWTPFTLVSTLITALIAFNFAIYPSMFPNQSWVAFVQGAWLSVLIIWSGINLYALPMWIEQDTKKWRIALKNGAILAGGNPLFTFLLMAMGLITVVSICFVLIPVGILFGVVFVVMLSEAATADRMAAYRKRMGLADPHADPVFEEGSRYS